MSLVDAAIQSGSCSLAVSGSLLRDAQVMLALDERGALAPMTLAGPAQAPVVPVGDKGLLRAVSDKGGVLAIVEPDTADQAELTKLAKLVGAAPHKPKVVVVSRSFNPLVFGSMFRGCKVEHVKDRGKAWIRSLPMPPAEASAPSASQVAEIKKTRQKKNAPSVQLVFVGRDDELGQLTEFLGTGGPIVVAGPHGIGRSTMIEHGIAKAGLTRLPDLRLSRKTGADALFARLAEITRAGGSDALAAAMAAPHTPKQLVAAALQALTDASGTEGQVMVIHDLHRAAGRQADFFRKSRLEMLLEALLTHAFPLRLVFTSLDQPVFHREGRDAPLRRMTLEGLKGRFYHEIFAAYGADEVPRDAFGPMSEKLHGNALAVRTYAVAVRHRAELAQDPKFFTMADAGDKRTLVKQLAKRVEALSDRQREMLRLLAHFSLPLTGKQVSDLGYGRKDRMALIGAGVLDVVGTLDTVRRVRVHPAVHRTFSRKEITDIGVSRELGQAAARWASKAEGVDKLAWTQEANRLFVQGRAFRDLLPTEFSDHDALLDGTIGLLRSRSPRFDLAERRIADALKADPANADAHLLKLELLRRSDAKHDAIQAAIDEAIAKAPVPEVFHEAVGYHLSRRARGKAIKVLEDAVEALPDVSRLRTRLASLMLRGGRRPEAIDHLNQAMELDPMLPDAYGLLGQARREEGAERLDEAETLLREAVRLAPGDVIQASRLVWLLLDIARGVPERTEALREEITALLDDLLQQNKDSHEVHLLYAVALREAGGDTQRARWFLKKARKLAPRRDRKLDVKVDIERSLLELVEGKLDDAEGRLRKLSRKEPSNHRVFAALAKVLEARGQHVAAHAELMRAAERTSPHSLDRQAYDAELSRLQAAIEAAAQAMAAGLAPEAAAAAGESAAEAGADVIDPQADGAKADGATDAKATDAKATDAPATDAKADDDAKAGPDATPEAPAPVAAPPATAPTVEAAPAEGTDAADPAEASASDAASTAPASAEGTNAAEDTPDDAAATDASEATPDTRPDAT